MTHKLNDYNEIYNVNKHIDKSTDEEMGRLLSIHNSLKIKILKLKQQYLLFEHSLHTYRFRCNIIYFTFIVTSALLLIIGYYYENKISNMWTFILFTVTSLIYCILVLIFIKNNSNRRSYAYNQYYWKNMERKL
jgi:hypothetical protein